MTAVAEITITVNLSPTSPKFIQPVNEDNIFLKRVLKFLYPTWFKKLVAARSKA
jgi:hypothetical protein